MANTTSAPTSAKNPAPPSNSEKAANTPAPQPAPDTSNHDEERSLPEGKVVTSIPPTNRNGVWVTEYEWFEQNPRKIKMYEGVSQTTASYLRGKFGLDAQARNTRKVPKQGGEPGQTSVIVDLYVRLIPEKVEEIKAAAKSKAGKTEA
jgi:hypothetical protein